MSSLKKKNFLKQSTYKHRVLYFFATFWLPARMHLKCQKRGQKSARRSSLEDTAGHREEFPHEKKWNGEIKWHPTRWHWQLTQTAGCGWKNKKKVKLEKHRTKCKPQVSRAWVQERISRMSAGRGGLSFCARVKALVTQQSWGLQPGFPREENTQG